MENDRVVDLWRGICAKKKGKFLSGEQRVGMHLEVAVVDTWSQVTSL